MRTILYTDGSISNQRKVVREALASWAFVVVERGAISKHMKGDLVRWQSGFVITDPQHSEYIGAQKVTNNTAELSAIYWALFYLNKKKMKPSWIFTDSRYAMRCARGGISPNKNKELVRSVRGLFIGSNHQVKWVKGHAGFRFNEMADRFAKAQLGF